jgi:hypothetical protein
MRMYSESNACALILRRVFSTLLVLATMACSAELSTLLYRAAWDRGLDENGAVQANPGDLTIVEDPAQKTSRVLQATIGHSEDFQKIVNGAPRAELLISSVRFKQGETYRIRWSTMIPIGARFDPEQLVILTQIHQGAASGPPTIALTLQGSRYAISQRGGMHADIVSAAQWLCCANTDVGKWVNWELVYRPNDSGQNAYTELLRDGTTVFLARDLPNAYSGDESAYLKIGLYKPAWQKKATAVDQVSMLFGSVVVTQDR